MEEVRIKPPFIKLGQLLKYLDLIETGGSEKEFLENPEAVKAKQEAIIQLIQQYEKEIIRLTKLLEEVTQEMEELRKRKRENR